jgi:hypothetical protein
VDLIAEKTLKNPYLIQSIEKSKVQLLWWKRSKTNF